MKSEGSRAEVMHGHANHTSGGLKKKDLKVAHGRIVSKKASSVAKRKLTIDAPFRKFINFAKDTKGKKFKKVPKKNTQAYKKLMKKKPKSFKNVLKR